MSMNPVRACRNGQASFVRIQAAPETEYRVPWPRALDVSEQQNPIVLFRDRRTGLRRRLRHNTEAAQEVAVHVALALHRIVGEQVVEDSLVACAERGLCRGTRRLETARDIGQCAGAAAE